MSLPLAIAAGALIIITGFLIGQARQSHNPPATTTTSVVARSVCITISGAALPPGVYCRTPLNQIPTP